MNRLPHILHVIQTLGSGGAERQLLTYLSDPQIQMRFRHTVAMTDVADIHADDPQNFLVDSFERLGVEVIGLGCPGTGKVLSSISALRRMIRERDIDLVHTQLLWANVAGRIAARLSGVPVVTSFQNSDYDPVVMEAYHINRFKHGFIRRLDAVTSRSCLTHSVAVSEYVSEHIQKYLGLKPETVSVIHNTYSQEHFVTTIDDPRDKIFRDFGLSPDSRLVLTVGRLVEQKGHVELIEAFAEVVRQQPDAHLAIVGAQTETSYVRQVLQAIDETGCGANVHLIPPRSDIADILAAADIFVFPSKFEGLGIALIEAMAAGLPCVASDIPPILELIRDGVTGMIVPLGDTKALAAEIVHLLTDRAFAKRLGDQARQEIRERFDPAVKAADMAALYEKLVSARNKPPRPAP